MEVWLGRIREINATKTRKIERVCITASDILLPGRFCDHHIWVGEPKFVLCSSERDKHSHGVGREEARRIH